MRSAPAAVAAVLLLLAGCIGPAAPSTPTPPAGQAFPMDPAGLGKSGRWEPFFEGQVAAVSMAVLHDGRVLYWSGVEAAGDDDQDFTFLLSHPHDADDRVLAFAPDGSVASISRPGGDSGSDLFCAGQTILPDGRVLAAGGTNYTTIPTSLGGDVLYGTRDARVFDPALDQWVRVDDMDHGRWYPSVINLPSGEALVASGIEKLTQPTTLQTALERFDHAAQQWVAAGEKLLPMYSRLIVVPAGPLKGHVFYSTVSTLWGPFGEHPEEASWSLQQAYDPASKTWQDLAPSLFGARQHGVSVLLPLDPAEDYHARVLSFGGTLQRGVAAVPFAEIADLGGAVQNKVAAPLGHARWHANGVLLPDGKVLAVGGGMYDNVVLHGQPNQPVLPAELYDPSSDTWTEMPAMAVPRMYHSTAVLLPDGRVLAGGHVPLPVPFKTLRDNPVLGGTPATQAQVKETRLEIFDPPYLFRGPRPEITSVPADDIAYGRAFDAGVAGSAADITTALLIRPGATTHAFDSDQRVVRLTISGADGGTLHLQAPPDADVAPPGYYMLFVGLGAGDAFVPSVAKFVHLGTA